MTITTGPRDHLALVDELRARQLPERARRKEIREAAGASVSDVARACGVTHFAVRSWEKPGGRSEPNPAHALVYRQVLEALDRFGRELAAARRTE